MVDLVEGEIRGERLPTSICGVGLMQATLGLGLVDCWCAGNWDKTGLGMVWLKQGDNVLLSGIVPLMDTICSILDTFLY